MDRDFGPKEIMNRIARIKDELGSELVILTHHYQRREIVDLGDHRGDSFSLARRAARDEKAKYIVFCGVHFMAESAAILAKESQIVQIPDTGAGCWLSDMGQVEKIQQAWQEAADLLGEEAMAPVAYINSSAGVKAMCGRLGGTVCTSSNALKAFEWAFERRDKIFFFPTSTWGGIRLKPWTSPKPKFWYGILPSPWAATVKQPSERPGSSCGKATARSTPR